MKFEMTKCRRCVSEILMGVEICPSCGKEQNLRSNALQLRTILAIGLTAAALFAFNWFKPPPHASQAASPPSANLPSR